MFLTFIFRGRWGLTKKFNDLHFHRHLTLEQLFCISCTLPFPPESCYFVSCSLSDDCQMHARCPTRHLSTSTRHLFTSDRQVPHVRQTWLYHMYFHHTSIGGSLDLSHLWTVWSNIFIFIFICRTLITTSTVHLSIHTGVEYITDKRGMIMMTLEVH